MKKEKELTRREKLKLKAKASALKFKRELKKSTVTAIIAAFGFLIALTWRDVIIEWVTKISEASPLKNNLIIAIIVTILSVMGIVVISRFDNEEKNN
ncbi:DUF5654 family protein [Candidatus Pacearchaeota archaeon]|jgi:TRAP-type C4-dicarboxylate transport system permease small subunit|nr:DUF5654 family protein [Candidatus Pacearchaeota archaeon]